MRLTAFTKIKSDLSAWGRTMKGIRQKKVRKFTFHELLFLWTMSLAAVVGCCWLLFQQFGISLLVAGILSPLVFWKVRVILQARFDRRVEKEFSDILVVLAGSLTAGLSLERCIGEIADNPNSEYKLLRKEFSRMQQLIQFNWPVEYAFEEFAGRFQNGDIRVFSAALQTGIPAGINLVELVRQISAAVRMKRDTEAEITRVLNLPKYNNRIVMVMPFLSVFAVRTIAPSYGALLNTGIGGLIMGIACCLLGLAFVLGEFLGRIRY